MNISPGTGSALAVAVWALTACTSDMPGEARTPAEAACVSAVGSGAEVMASETTATGSRVLVLSGDGVSWSCTATNDGTIADLARV